MSNSPREQAVESIILETIQTLPKNLVAFYRDLPGRRPSDHSIRMSHIIAGLDDDDALALLRDVTDATVFSLLGLFDAQFKDGHIRVRFDWDATPGEPDEDPLLEIYRMRVDPGGAIAA